MDSTHPVVLVTINYRLNIFGFLTTEDSDLPGNYGLWDQREALVWIWYNINKFGGHPQKVTIFGGSAGAASVHFHLVSPASRGLFQGAIAQSGSAFMSRAITPKPGRQANQLARLVGCNRSTNKKLAECLRKVPAEQLMEALEVFMPPKFGILPNVFRPWIDGHFLPGEIEEVNLGHIKLGYKKGTLKLGYIQLQNKIFYEKKF